MSKQRIISILLTLCVAFSMFTCIIPASNVQAASTGTVVNCYSYVNVRKEPSNQSASLGTIKLGAVVNVLDTVPASTQDKSGYATWYKISFSQNGTNTTGYVATYYINKDAENVQTDAAFESSIAQFPDSYKVKLRSIHAAYPNWKFVPVFTNVDWTDALNMETALGKSLVETSTDRSWKSLAAGAYDPATDTFTIVDAPRWVNASRAIVAYYMDPRNSLNESSIFQFLDLDYPVDDAVTSTTIDQMLANTFMSSANGPYGFIDETERTYAEMFAIAGNMNNINPLFLATKVLQECGSRGSTSSDGATGYYNLYNIGAYSSVYSASMLGLQFAQNGNGEQEFNERYMIPWTTPGLSIVGGSKWICNNYVHNGQNTIYFMRFNFNPQSSNKAGTHQYMTATQSSVAEASRIHAAYVRSGAINGAITFQIPVFNNMPDSACPLPTSENAAYEFVENAYKLVLGRTPSSEEVIAWSNQLTNKAEAVDVLAGLVFSDEASRLNLSDSDFINRINKLLTGADASESTLNSMLELINAGYSRKYIYSRIANSNATVMNINLYGLIPGTYQSDSESDTQLGLVQFVNMLYVNFLGRQPDIAGRDSWVLAIRNGQSGPQAAADFFNSSEYLEKNISNEAFVTQLYQTCLGRNPDTNGFNSWVGLLDRQYSRDHALAGFVNSNEFKSICTQYGVSTTNYTAKGPEYAFHPNRDRIGQFVTFLYTSTLGREPDEAGRNDWISAIADRGVPGDEAAYGFVFSDELIARGLSNEDFVTMLYGAFLGRTPDQAGFDAWVARLNEGVSRREVFDGFVYSTEFVNKCIYAGFKPYASYKL